MKVIITTEVNENGHLIIGETDMSSSANDSFGSDIETDLYIKKRQKVILMKKISGIFNRISSDEALLNWLKKKYDGIDAIGKIEQLLKSKGIDYEKSRWP